MPKRLLRLVLSGLIAAALLLAAAYLWDMRNAYERIRGKSTIIASPLGDIEYAEGGTGPHVLVVHGSGGGFDQGELFARALFDEEFHWIVPSRFGYLRSTFRAGATFDDQAHAYAHLLDKLGINKVAVVAISHGAPSALLFAALHPDRVSSLTLISAGVASSTTQSQTQADQRGNALTTIFRHDPLYWALSKLFNRRLMDLMGASAAVVAELNSGQRDLIDRMIDGMNPVSPRSAGVLFDNTAAMPNERIAAVRAPTLILHAADDTLQIYRNAEFAASTIPGAKLVRFEKGGHFLLAVELSACRALTQEHIRNHLNQEWRYHKSRAAGPRAPGLVPAQRGDGRDVGRGKSDYCIF